MPYAAVIVVMLLLACIVVAAYFYLKRAQARTANAVGSTTGRADERATDDTADR